MADTIEEAYSGGNGHGYSEAETAAVRELVDDRGSWPLDRYERDRGFDWLRFWDAWLVVGLAFIEVILAFRLGFRLIGANAENGFVSLTYDAGRILVSPFTGIIADSKLGNSGIFEPSILVAMLVYLVGAGLLMSIGWAIKMTDQAHDPIPSYGEAALRRARP